jgi:hypothetical protein
MNILTIMEATGKARCKLCNHMIEKGALAVKFEGYQSGFQIHFKTAICQQGNGRINEAVTRIMEQQIKRGR